MSVLSKIKGLFNKEKIKSLKKNEYAKNTSILMVGTTVGMAISLLSSPLLAKLYTDADFGVLQIFTSFYSILVIVATLRYEFAIMLPKDDSDAFPVLCVSLLSSVIVSALCAVLVLIIKIFDVSLFGLNAYSWLIYMPLTLLILGVYYSCNYWLNRRKRYKNLAVNRIVQNVLIVALSVVFSKRFFFIKDGMIISYILAMAVVMVLLIIYVTIDYKRLGIKVKSRDIVVMCKRYKRFPLNTMPTGLLNTFAAQMPVFILRHFFGEGVVGQYYMMNRVLATPITVVGQAVADVFRQKASSTYAIKKECRDVYRSTAKVLALLAIVPFALLMLFARPVFSFVLGDSWLLAGTFVMLLSPFYFVRLVVSPLTFMTIVAEKQRYELIWQFSMLVLTSAAMTVSCLILPAQTGSNMPYYAAMLAYGAVYTVMYGIHFNYTRRLARGQDLWG